MDDLLDRMSARVMRHTRAPYVDTDLPGVAIGVVRQRSVSSESICRPGVCLVLQGSKQMLVGERRLRYHHGSCFAALVELPTTRLSVEARPDKPYVATSVTFDHAMLSALIADVPAATPTESTPGFGVSVASRPLLEAWDRYLELLDTPRDLAGLAPARARELLYRLLQGPQGPMLRQIMRNEGTLSRVRRAIDRIHRDFDKPLPVTTLAKAARMSVPSFHRHFKELTALSPLQYQKAIRLQRARRMLAGHEDVTHTAFAVGYESASQFSREYSRLFGLSPKRDAARLRDTSFTVEML